MSDFLASDKSEEYKRSILSLLDGGSKNTKKRNRELSEMNIAELYKIAKSLEIKNYSNARKDELIQKIKSNKNNNKENGRRAELFKMKKTELDELAKSLGVKNYTKNAKCVIIQGIENVEKKNQI